MTAKQKREMSSLYRRITAAQTAREVRKQVRLAMMKMRVRQ